MSYFDYNETLTDDNGKEYSGINYNIPDFSLYKDLYEPFKITMQSQYRPDIIANFVYGNGDLSWVIDEVNNVSHFSFYELGKIIYILPYNILISLGIE